MRKGFYFPIILKLIILTTVMLVIVTLGISYKSAEQFESISTDREESTNLDIADSASVEVDNLIQSYVDKINFYSVGSLNKTGANEESGNISFHNDPEFYGLIVKNSEESKGHSNLVKIVNRKNIKPEQEAELEFAINKITQALSSKDSLSFEGKIQVYNMSELGGFPIIAVGMPLLKNEVGQITSIAWGFIKIDRLQRSFSNTSERKIFLIDRDGRVIAHPDEKLVLKSTDLSAMSIIKDAVSSNIRVKQKYYTNGDEKILGAFAKTATDLIVVSELPMSVVYAPSLLVKKSSYYILGLSLSISFFFIFLFSQSLTLPIEKLLEITKEIASGNFNVEAKKVIKAHDEVGLLAEAFDDMTLGLKERDKVKSLFNKFHGTAVTEELLKNEVGLGGKRKNVTVFFSDIRGFTDMSEKNTSEEIVSMLNEYFEVMVHIINRNGGVVDKFIGDAIMAVWGVPNEGPDDAVNAVKACLEMRLALNKLNESRIDRNLVPIKIGMGLHSGEAISGQIGSSERMEFTVIGDAVNTASRIEGSTKSFGTDLLISTEVVSRIGDMYLLTEAGSAKVQGKKDTLTLFKVRGVIDNGQERIIETPYSTYEAVEDKKSKVAS